MAAAVWYRFPVIARNICGRSFPSVVHKPITLRCSSTAFMTKKVVKIDKRQTAKRTYLNNVQQKPKNPGFKTASDRSQVKISSNSINDRDQLAVIEAIKKATDVNIVDQIVNITITESKGRSFHHQVIVESLKKVCEIQKGEAIEPSKISFLLNYLEGNCTGFNALTLLPCTKSLLTIFHSDIKVIELVEKEMVSKLEELDIDQLVACHVAHQNQKTELRTKTAELCTEIMKRKLFTVSNYNQLIYLLEYFSNLHDKDSVSKLLDIVFNKIDKLTNEQYVTVLNSVARIGLRPESFLRGLVFYLNMTYKPKSLNKVNSLLLSCAQLSFYDLQLFKNISENILSFSESKLNNLSKCGLLLSSMGMLGWRNEDTIRHILHGDLLEKEFKEVTEITNLEKIVVSLANLNFCPEDKLNILESKVSRISKEKCSTLQWLNFVWGLSVLQRGSPQLYSSVLDPAFIEKLREGNKNWKFETKLVAINNTASISKYEGPVLSEKFLQNYVPLKDQAIKKSMIDDIVGTLEAVAGTKDMINSHVATNAGYTIDAEVYIDQTGEIVKASEKEDGTNSKRVAIRGQGFHDLTFPTNELKGPEAVIVRHIESQGYTVLPIPHHQWSELSTSDKKIAFIKDKLLSLAS